MYSFSVFNCTVRETMSFEVPIVVIHKFVVIVVIIAPEMAAVSHR